MAAAAPDGPSDAGACCAPAPSAVDPGPRVGAADVRVGDDPRPVAPSVDLIALEGGAFTMGTDGLDAFPGDAEGPARPVTVSPFRIAATAVTNAMFASFVDATGHLTDAERHGWSFVFGAFVGPEDVRHVVEGRVLGAPWWRGVRGASWRHPEGPSSDVVDRADHPVVHVSHRDATACAAWFGARLPTEAEWEFAARGGLEDQPFPWGADLEDATATGRDRHRCNVWQGEFPITDTGEDGWRGTAPVDAYAPNRFGLHNVVGNVWEWCADWFGRDHVAGAVDPRGPKSGSGRVIKGGSYLCHGSYCNRYRTSARSSNTPDASTGHMGFRLAADG